MITNFKYIEPIAEAYLKIVNEYEEPSQQSGSRMDDSERILYFQDRIKFAEREIERLRKDKRYLVGKGDAINRLRQSIENSRRQISELTSRVSAENVRMAKAAQTATSQQPDMSHQTPYFHPSMDKQLIAASFKNNDKHTSVEESF